nr:tetratricopeptide repeat protein [Deltaproteobacteria bacterium]
MSSTERDERDDEAEEVESSEASEAEQSAEDPNVPKNRAERRAAAKAARRGRVAVLADGTTPTGDEAIGEVSPDGSGLMLPTTSLGGNPAALAEAAPGAGRRRPPPRTMSKGTGDSEGVPEWARSIGDSLGQHRRTLTMAAAAVVVVVGASLAWQTWRSTAAAKAADAYSEALQVSTATIEPEDAPAREDAPTRRGPVFRSVEARLRASVEKFRQVEQRYPQSRVAPLARLSEATALYQLGRYQEARQLYQGLMGADTAGLEARVLEGMAFTLESLNDLDGAAARYRELGAVQNAAYRDLAQYYQARLFARRDDRVHAKELLHGVIERTAHPTAADPLAASIQSLREQAVALLREIDPQDPQIVEYDRARAVGGGAEGEHGHEGGGRNPLDSLPPDLRRQLEEALRKQGRR